MVETAKAKAKAEGKVFVEEKKPEKLVSDGQVIAVGYPKVILVKTATNTNPDGCAKYSKRQSDGSCKADACTSTQRLLTLGSCEECGSVDAVSANGLECLLVAKVSAEGKCSFYTKKNAAGTACEADTCAFNQRLNIDGTCKNCSPY